MSCHIWWGESANTALSAEKRNVVNPSKVSIKLDDDSLSVLEGCLADVGVII